MPPASIHPLIEGLKDKVDSVLAHGDKLFVALGGGSLSVYVLDSSEDGSPLKASLLEARKAVSRRAIEQMSFIRQINALVILSDANLTLLDPLTLKPHATPLPPTKGALTFSTHTFVSRPPSTSPSSSTPAPPPPSLVTLLAVGLKRRLVLHSWVDGSASTPPPAPLILPHTPRSIAIVSPSRAILSYSSSHQALVELEPLKVVLAELPAVSETGAAQDKEDEGGRPVSVMSGLAGVGGYMGGLVGAGKGKAVAVRVREGEALVLRDAVGVFLNSEGVPSRTKSLVSPVPLEDVALTSPFLASILPSSHGSSLLPPSTTANLPAHPSIQIQSSTTLTTLQTIALPTLIPNSTTGPLHAHALHHLTPSLPPSSQSSEPRPPLFVVSTPTERSGLAAEGGSKLWWISFQDVGLTVDELVSDGSYAEALALAQTADDRQIPNRTERLTLLRALNALALFRSTEPKKKQKAVEEFVELEVNPARVVALFGEVIGWEMLSVKEQDWVGMFGGPKGTEGDGSAEKKEPLKVENVNTKASLESLLHYLSDRRQKVLGVLPDLPPDVILTLEALPPLSSISKEDLFSIPPSPISELDAEQVYRIGQVVDTALFKTYLLIRPTLVGSLCRLSNYCEVAEVEGVLKEKKKYSDLIDLYRTRKSHQKALDFLKELSKDESDLEDKLEPSVRYLHALGPKYIDLICRTSRWILQTDFDWGMKIFTADPETVEPLPKHDVLKHLSSISPRAEIAYLEFLIVGQQDETAEFHERLAELYLDEAKKLSKGKGGKKRDEFTIAYERAVVFLKASTTYRANRLLRFVPDDDLFEARAVLLGRLGNHENALQIYVAKLQDFEKAEAYCASVHERQPSTNVFLLLLRIYLLPRPPHTDLLIGPALSLIGKHSTKLEPVEVLSLLPPLLTMDQLEAFTKRTLVKATSERNLGKMVVNVGKSRLEGLESRLMRLQERRVRIQDTRLCPQCKKRLGNSVLAVHAPHGEVTHIHCKDAYSATLRERALEQEKFMAD